MNWLKPQPNKAFTAERKKRAPAENQRSVHLPQRPYTLASKEEKEETHEFEDHNQKRN